jgi:Na+-translocating ferredoxin:NAD+ oxidoreductase RnfG subunit
MKAKDFFKSKSFKCVLVLLCIALVAGALLSICNDLLGVSEEERVGRTIKGIYGKQVSYTVVNTDYTTENGSIDKVYYLADGNYLIKATGKGGYKMGTVTVWLVAKFSDGAFAGIGSVSVADYEKQTLMSKITSSFMDKYTGLPEEGEKYDTVVSGATYSSTAINNAVNTAVAYVYDSLAVKAE